jgi:hypothetical protein
MLNFGVFLGKTFFFQSRLFIENEFFSEKMQKMFCSFIFFLLLCSRYGKKEVVSTAKRMNRSNIDILIISILLLSDDSG